MHAQFACVRNELIALAIGERTFLWEKRVYNDRPLCAYTVQPRAPSIYNSFQNAGKLVNQH